MKNQEFIVNDIGSNTTEESNNKEKPIWKKYLLPIIIAISILVFALIIILIFTLKSSGNKNDKNKTIYGVIKCIYYIEEKQTVILGEEFKKENDLEIFIDNIQIKYSKEYIFQSMGDHLIEYKLYENRINMDYMFKNVHTLINAEFISENQIHIESMISTFENCIILFLSIITS